MLSTKKKLRTAVYHDDLGGSIVEVLDIVIGLLAIFGQQGKHHIVLFKARTK